MSIIICIAGKPKISAVQQDSLIEDDPLFPDIPGPARKKAGSSHVQDKNQAARHSNPQHPLLRSYRAAPAGLTILSKLRSLYEPWGQNKIRNGIQNPA